MPTGRREEWLVVEPQAAVCQDCFLLSSKPFLQKDSEGASSTLFSCLTSFHCCHFCSLLLLTPLLLFTSCTSRTQRLSNTQFFLRVRDTGLQVFLVFIDLELNLHTSLFKFELISFEHSNSTLDCLFLLAFYFSNKKNGSLHPSLKTQAFI